MSDPESHALKASKAHIARIARKIDGSPKGKLKCQACGAMNASRNRQRTAYVNDSLNIAVLCPDCQDEADAYWDDMWTDYYANCM